MAKIHYSDSKEFCQDDLEGLFCSVGWSSGRYPAKLKVALRNSDAVYSAWHGSRLVGLINALSDSVMTVYFHYLLVRPEYQGMGIGRELVRLMLQRYEGFLTKVLISYDSQVGFYRKCGFEIGKGSTPMKITQLRN